MDFKSLTLDDMIKRGTVVDAAFVPAIRPDVAKDIAEKHAAAVLDKFIKNLSSHEHDISFDCDDGYFLAYEIESSIELERAKTFNSLEELQHDIREQS